MNKQHEAHIGGQLMTITSFAQFASSQAVDAALQNSFWDLFQTLSDINFALYKFYTISTTDIERGEPDM